MADLKVKVLTDGVDKAKGEISSLGGAGNEAEGGISKMGAAAVVGAGALIALGTKSIMAFEDLGLTVGKFSAATGISATESSKLIEVAGDLGIGTDTLQKGVINMTKALGPAGDGLRQFGIEAIKNKDGTVNLSETMVEAAGKISQIQDPLKKTEAQAAVFGKSFGKMAELTGMSADELRKKMGQVSDAKIFDEDKVNKAKDLRDGFDTIKDAGENLFLTIGTALAPVVAELAQKIGGILEKVLPLASAIGDLLVAALEALGPVIDGILTILGPVITGLKAVLGAVTDIVSGLHDAFTEDVTATIDMTGVKEATETKKAAAEEVAAATKKETDATLAASQALQFHKDDAAAATEAEKAYTDRLNNATKALEADRAAQEALSNAFRVASDKTYAVRDAADAYAKSVGELGQKIEDAKGDQATIDRAYRDTTSSAADLANKTVDLAINQAELDGKTLSAAQKLDGFNLSMLQSAATATGPLRQSIIDYIASTNGIPAEKATAISAAVEAGDLATAIGLINDASKARTVALKTDADDASLAEVGRKLDEITKDRIAKVGVVISGNGGSSKVFAGGTDDAPGGIALVGDDPRQQGSGELILSPKGGKIRSAQETAQILRDASGGNDGAGYVDQSTTVNYWPPGVSPDTLVKAQRRTSRRGLEP